MGFYDIITSFHYVRLWLIFGTTTKIFESGYRYLIKLFNIFCINISRGTFPFYVALNYENKYIFEEYVLFLVDASCVVDANCVVVKRQPRG